jgi:hypothetical protein
MSRVIRSELTRLFRPRLLLGGFGLTALFAVMINLIIFSVATQQSSAPTGPGVTFPTAEQLASPDGVVAGLASAASMFGVVTLAFWAISGASDYQTGLMRILASTQPRRWMLVVGKAIALALVKRSIDSSSELEVISGNTRIPGNQEVLVPVDAGATRALPRLPRLGSRG